MATGRGELDRTDRLVVPRVPVLGGHGELPDERLLPVDVEADRARVLRVERLHRVAAGRGDVHRVVDPLAVGGPADVELVHERAHRVRVVEVGEVLHVGHVDALSLAEAPEVRPAVRPLVEGLRVELPAAVVDGIAVVIGHALAAQVVERALHDPRDALRAGPVGLVLVRAPRVRFAPGGRRPERRRRGGRAERQGGGGAGRAEPRANHRASPPPRAARRTRGAACPPRSSGSGARRGPAR